MMKLHDLSEIELKQLVKNAIDFKNKHKKHVLLLTMENSKQIA